MSSQPVPERAAAELAALVSRGGVMILSGAGLSTDSGIPDYRGPSGIRRGSQPMMFAEFRDSSEGRRRYWARSHAGWSRFSAARPNAAHHAVRRLQQSGLLSGIVTQNVDRLHSAAGSDGVIDLHGRLDRVVCLDCDERTTRSELGRRLAELNPDFVREAVTIAPDGDATVDAEAIARFRVAACRRCGGTLKPDVVFFGESVPRERVDEAMALLEGSRALLVLGSSLTVYSGYRFVRRAAAGAATVAIVNRGSTRGDPEASLKIDAGVSEVLADVLARLGAAEVG